MNLFLEQPATDLAFFVEPIPEDVFILAIGSSRVPDRVWNHQVVLSPIP
jgi:hypothetical protein